MASEDDGLPDELPLDLGGDIAASDELPDELPLALDLEEIAVPHGQIAESQQACRPVGLSSAEARGMPAEPSPFSLGIVARPARGRGSAGRGRGRPRASSAFSISLPVVDGSGCVGSVQEQRLGQEQASHESIALRSEAGGTSVLEWRRTVRRKLDVSLAKKPRCEFGFCIGMPFSTQLDAARCLGLQAGVSEGEDGSLTAIARHCLSDDSSRMHSTNALADLVCVDVRYFGVDLARCAASYIAFDCLFRQRLEAAMVAQLRQVQLIQYMEVACYDETPLKVRVKIGTPFAQHP